MSLSVDYFCFVFYLYTAVFIFIDYSDTGTMVDINNDKC
jgi:hypothetical protein